MNIHTFKDAATSRRSALANEVADAANDDDDDAADESIARMRHRIEGEEQGGEEKFNEAGDMIEAFNLKSDRAEGYFDENMNFVFRKQRGEVDAWVAQMGDEAAVERAIGEASKAVKRIAAQRELEEAREARKEKLTPDQLKQELLSYMQPKETVAAAMCRFSNKDAARPRNHRSGRNPAGGDAASQTKQQQQDNRKRIERLTELADELLSSGYTNIYQASYESIRNSTVQWEYRGADGVIYGPYSANQIAGWKAQGFLTGPSAMMMRVVAPKESSNTGGIFDDDLITSSGNRKRKSDAVDCSSDGLPTDWQNSDQIDFGDFSEVIAEVEQRQGSIFALTGSGGTGSDSKMQSLRGSHSPAPSDDLTHARKKVKFDSSADITNGGGASIDSRQQNDEENDDDDDDDAEYDDITGGGTGHGQRRRRIEQGGEEDDD